MDFLKFQVVEISQKKFSKFSKIFKVLKKIFFEELGHNLKIAPPKSFARPFTMAIGPHLQPDVHPLRSEKVKISSMKFLILEQKFLELLEEAFHRRLQLSTVF